MGGPIGAEVPQTLVYTQCTCIATPVEFIFGYYQSKTEKFSKNALNLRPNCYTFHFLLLIKYIIILNNRVKFSCTLRTIVIKLGCLYKL